MPVSRYFIGTLPWYSVLVVTGMTAALLIAGIEEKRKGLPKDTVVDLALWTLPCGIIGARLYYVLFSWDTFSSDPVSILYLWNGGLAIYGGLIGGALAAFMYSIRKRISFPVIADILFPGISLGQAIGRWGNFFNMEAYGGVITDPALQFFPFAVLIPGADGAVWHQATFFYESCWDLMIFLFLFFLRRAFRKDGDTALWYLLLYGSGRQLIERLRTDSLMSPLGNFRVSQILGIVMAQAAFCCFALRCRKQNRLVPAAGIVIPALAFIVLSLSVLSSFSTSMTVAFLSSSSMIICGLCFYFILSRKET